MEKQLIDQHFLNGQHVRRDSTKMGSKPAWRAVLWTTLLTITLASLTWIRYSSHDNVSEVMFDDYRNIPASAKLIWHPCFDHFLCAKLQVPMNHNAPATPHDNTPLVEIALIMVNITSQGRRVNGNSNKQT
jgi:hypothetical protein